MARMIDGHWEGEWRPTDEDGDGAFLRKPSVFRDALPPEAPEPGRHHLFVAWTCNLHAMRRGYASIRAINPTGIAPAGPPSLLPT